MKTIDIFDPVSQTIHVENLPDPTMVFFMRQNYANIWSKYKNSVLYWGGNNKNPLGPGLVGNSVTELLTDSMTWSTMATQGTAPAEREGHCMAANEDGTKVVIYGGILANDTKVGDLWILDMIASTWSQGTSGPARVYSVCTIAGEQFLLWGGSTDQTLVSSPEMLIYNLNTSAYIQQYTPPAFYKNLKPPPPLTRTKAPWPINNPGLNSTSASIGVGVGSAVGGLVLMSVISVTFFIRRQRRQGQSYGILPRALARFLRLGQGNGRGGKGPMKNPQESPKDYELERSLRKLEDKRNKLEDQKKELNQRRELLVLQHQQLTLNRGPTSPIDSKDVFLVPLSAPHQVIPDPVTSEMYSREDLESRRTVQGVFGPLDMYQGDSYAGDGPRRQSEMAQDVIEPTYEPSPTINSAIPDLVYLQSQDVGMDWTRQQQSNHPHATLCLSSFISLQCLLTSAQTQTAYYTPTPVFYPAFARSINKLYVLGGAKSGGIRLTVLAQFMSLDLTIPWSAAAPAWTRLADGPRQYRFPGTLSSDEQTFFVFHVQATNSPWQYSIKDDSWQESVAKFENAEYVGIEAVTDPGTGLVYLAGGYDNVNYNAPLMRTIDIFDPVSQTVHVEDLPDPTMAFPVRLFYKNVWSKALNSVLYFGGKNKAPPSPDLVTNGVTLLSTASMTWTTMQTKGTAPSGRTNHCMSTNENGTMVAIYGGHLVDETVIGELWMLDIPTATWTQGPTGPVRSDSVCTIAGDQFLIWSGSRFRNMTTDPNEMLIYNLKSKTYIQEYTPPAFYKDLKPPPALTRTTAPWPIDPPHNSKSVPIGLVVGTVGGLVLIGAVIGMFFVQRQRRRDPTKDILQRFRRTQSRASRQRPFSSLLRRRLGLGEQNAASSKRDPQKTEEDLKLEKYLQELEDQKKTLEDQQRKLDLQRQRLVLQHQDSYARMPPDLKRAPSAYLDSMAHWISPPTGPHQPIPEPIIYSAEYLRDRRTVQAVPLYHASDGPRKESEMEQDVIETIYEPSPEVNHAIPDLAYLPSLDIGMDWPRQHQFNHPQTVVGTLY
ncbi:hypothetical protein BGZ47_011098 [Haplosporangium gracile]|nr:hypothetical protein BGZ47_011098 [Haplosporangium gracile]